MLSRLRKLSVQTKITVLLSSLLLLAVGFNVAWNYTNQMAQSEREMLEKTQILNEELKAVWEFVDINQNRIDTDANGSFNFKNIYCAIAGKSVASIFMRDTDYIVRYVNLNPRKASSRADEYERAALEGFGSDGAAEDVYEITTYDGREVFRYISPLYIEESCLRCHGEPAGEIDVTDFPMEGLKTGDLAGAISIVMPIDLYMQGIRENILSQSLYFFAVLAALILIARFAIAKLVKQLEKANNQLKQESTYKSDFLATMSHELRTPLTSIIAFTEVWEKEEGRSGPGKADAVAEIKDSSHVLLGMVDNILEAARIEAGRVELQREWVDMVDLLGTVEGVIAPLAASKHQTLTTQVDPDVPLIYADWEKLRRILENLGSNAVKFTKPGGSVSIGASFDPAGEGGPAVVVRVTDNGIGIREEDMGRLFQRFVQLDQSAQRRYKGSGIGLSVVRELAEAHGGAVSVESTYQEGSTFSVRIPVGEERPPDEGTLQDGGKDGVR